MDYIKPFGVTTAGRPPYQNGNPAAGIMGSIPDVRVWEYVMREILAVIDAAGLTPTNSNLHQLLDAIPLLIESSEEINETITNIFYSSKALTNIETYTTSTRVAMSAAAGVSVAPWSIPNYVKQNAASEIIAFLSVPYFAAGSGTASASQMNLAVGGVTRKSIPTQNTITSGADSLAGMSSFTTLFPGLADGPQTVVLSFTEPTSAWQGKFCPSGTDYSGFTGGTTATLILGETKP